jgi:dihydrofolate reductase
MARKFIVNVAVSADGYIARSDDSRPSGNYSMKGFLKTVDSVIWGRKTWDLAVMMGWPRSFGPKVRNYVFSRQTGPSPAEFAQRERGEPGGNLWIMGGGEIIASFLEAGAIDEFIIHTIPVLIGEGIPLLRMNPSSVGLELLGARKFADGVIRSHYRVAR